MFDLIDECGQDLKVFGYKTKSLYGGHITSSSLTIKTKSDSERLGLDKGEYFILSCSELYEYNLQLMLCLRKEMTRHLKKLFKDMQLCSSSKILIVGLGNSDIESDRLGKEVFDRIEIDPLDKGNNVFKFCPNIFFLTGINAIDIVSMIVKKLKIDLVIMIDSLTTNNISRLGTSFQITTSGMTPGSGVNRFGKKISPTTIGTKTISIGVPFMIFSSSLSGERKNDILLAPKDISSNITLAGEIIAEAVNEVLL